MPDDPIPPEEEPTLTDPKAKLLADVQTDLPDGIRNFLEAEIPEPPAVTMPTDVDSAILVNGICAWYVLELFRPLAGLQLVQIPLWLGQYNTVQQGMLLTSLEYKQESQAAQDFEIIAPQGGRGYYPGELRISAKALSGAKIQSMSGTLGAQSFSLVSKDDAWVQYVELSENGEYSLTLTAKFTDGDPVSHTTTFYLGDQENMPPEIDPEDIQPAEGIDAAAVEKAGSQMQAALKALADQSVLDVPEYAKSLLNVVKAQYGVYGKIAGSVLDGDVKGAVDTAITEVNGILDNFEQEIENYDPEGDPLELGNIVGMIWNKFNIIQSMIGIG